MSPIVFKYSEHVEALRGKVKETELQLNQLRSLLEEAERDEDREAWEKQDPREREKQRTKEQEHVGEQKTLLDYEVNGLKLDEYRRYGRQMLLPQIGLSGQQQLKQSRVLVVGLGGLGCPAAIYLAAAGVGTLGLMDGDVVEESNLHRQVLHTTGSIGSSKAFSAYHRLKELNPHVKYIPISNHLQPEHSIENIKNSYDLILDCTDRPSTRYMISDLAVLTNTPLISASALKTEGQLLTLNYPPCTQSPSDDSKGFCYRCVFPRPPPPESLQSCSEGGILGPVVGVMGVLMATEALKMLTTPPPAELQESTKRMLLYSAYSDPQFRTVKLKGKRKGCVACGWPPSITKESMTAERYETFCGSAVLPTSEGLAKITPEEFKKLRDSGEGGPIVVDVRSKTEFGICSLNGARNVPLGEIERDPGGLLQQIDHPREANGAASDDGESDAQATSSLVFVCRYGNDSRVAAKRMTEYCKDVPEYQGLRILDLVGGLKKWKDAMDPLFPEY